MRFKLSSIGEGRFGVDLEGHPERTWVFDSRTSKPETLVQEGRWLFAFFPTWNGHDRGPVGAAIDMVEDCGGDLRLGIQPYDDLSEVVTWLRGAGVPEAEAAAVGGPLLTTQVSGGDGEPRTLHIGSDPNRTLVWLALRDGVVREIRLGVRMREEIEAMIAEWFPANR